MERVSGLDPETGVPQWKLTRGDLRGLGFRKTAVMQGTREDGALKRPRAMLRIT